MDWGGVVKTQVLLEAPYDSCPKCRTGDTEMYCHDENQYYCCHDCGCEFEIIFKPFKKQVTNGNI